jgi:hemoglobin
MRERHDIRDRTDIARLIERFYGWAFADPELGPLFTEIAEMDLEAHMPIMCDFWETVLFQAGSYRRNAFDAHRTLDAQVPLTAKLFQRWLDLWDLTVDELFTGPKATLAKVQAGRIAHSIRRRLDRTTGDREVLTITPRLDN